MNISCISRHATEALFMLKQISTLILGGLKMYSYYTAYLIGARDQSCEDKILLVQPFICVVSPSLSCTLYRSPSHAHVHTHCVK